MKQLLISSLFYLTLVPMPGWGQVPNVRFEQLSARDGLPGSAVYSITRDRQGFMWFGTRRCPTRYDGTSFRSFLFPETYLITGLAADSANRMWVATDRKGLCRIDPDGLTLNPIPNTPTTTGYFYIDRRGEGWFSHEGGVGRINLRTGRVRLYRFPPMPFNGLKAYEFLEDRQQRLWVVGSVNGLFRFDPTTDRFRCVLGADCPRADRRALHFLSRGCVGSDGFLWIGTYAKGLLRYDPQTDQIAYFPTPDPSNDVTCVQEGCDEAGRRLLWVGDSQGLLVFRPDQGRFFRLNGLRPAPFFTHCLYVDPATGTVWAGTSDGVLCYNPQDNRIRTIALPAALVRQPVVIKVVRPDRRDTTGQTFWLGLSHTGLLRWHRPTNQFTLVRYPDATSETTWFDQTANGYLWIGLRRLGRVGDGVLVYNPDKGRYVANPAAKRVTGLFGYPYVDHGFIDKEQRLWVGNFYLGVRVLDSQTGQRRHDWPDSLTDVLHRNNNFLNHMALAPNGTVWLATYQGLYYLDTAPAFFRNADAQNPKSQQPDDPVTNTVLVARNGHIWAARWGSVTESRPDGKLLTRLTARDGLFDRENRQLAEDQYGTIWIGNFEGLHAYNPHTRKLWRLTVSDGLSENNTLNALYVHRGREVMVGQTNGLCLFDVRQVAPTSANLPVVITSFRVQEQERSLPPVSAVRLARTDNAFSVDFAALTYSRLPNVQYAYRLDGLEDHWHYSGTRHRATYTNLGPGRYVLNLKAANTLGQWGHSTQLQIVVLPAYYETVWFRLLAGLAIVGALYGVYRYRVNQLLRIQHIRNRISADLHDEIGSSLSSISILGTMANRSLPGGHPLGAMVERIVSEARQVSSSLDDIVWSIAPRNDTLGSPIARINRYAAELFEAAGIEYELRIPEAISELKLPMEQRQDFYLIVKEAVNNLVKHAHASRATIAISLDQRQVRMLISDNGVGFDATQPTGRNGLHNMQVRAQKLNGRLTVGPAHPHGTLVKLEFPIRRRII